MNPFSINTKRRSIMESRPISKWRFWRPSRIAWADKQQKPSSYQKPKVISWTANQNSTSLQLWKFEGKFHVDYDLKGVKAIAFFKDNWLSLSFVSNQENFSVMISFWQGAKPETLLSLFFCLINFVHQGSKNKIFKNDEAR